MAVRLRALIASAAVLGWSALALRLYVPLAAHAGLAQTIVNFVSYFTVLSNILAALVLSAWTIRPNGRGRLSRPGMRAATVVYMTVVSVVYVAFLRGAWAPQGLALVGETLMHYVMPPLYILCWAVAAPKGLLNRRQTRWWLLFPAAYFLYCLAHGAVSGFYPYFFIDVNQLGYGGVLLSALILLAVFWGLGLLVVAIDRALARRWPESA